MKKVTVVMLALATIGLASCGESKSPEEYAEEFCECMKDTENKTEDCKKIVEEAKDEYAGDEEAEKAFKEAVKECASAS